MPSTRKEFKDQMGRSVFLPNFPPKRIVSLVPSQTELLAHLELEREVVGITKFCVHPRAWFKGKFKVGGTKKVYLDRVRSLKPDLIIGNKEENEREQILELEKEFPVWMSDISTLPDALDMISEVGRMTNRHEGAQELIAQVRQKFDALTSGSSGDPGLRVLYLIWRKPWMAAGTETFIGDLIRRCGWQNALGDKGSWQRYPVLAPQDIVQMQPDLILLSSEPYPFKEKHGQELNQWAPSAQTLLVDGEMFSWYGSRLLEAVDYLKQKILMYAG